MKKTFLILCALLPAWTAAPQKATLTETVTTMTTYPFGDPNPVACPDYSYYPYFRFDGFTDKGEPRQWKTVVLENNYLRVTLFPEIGGKIWGAVEKSTSKEFIYYNDVVKFRDIAMRGAWVSGGIEYNFGIIGHAPTSATPVDYMTRTKADGSVSCYLSANDYITRTNWTVEVNLPADKAFFTTRTTWYNASSIDQPYYQWMNAAYKAAGNAQFCYPGNRYIGHDGKSFSFPVDDQGRDLSWYKNNAFESSKSYHVMGHYNDFYGAYWHDDDFGSVHYARPDGKLGMKIFLWSQAQDGKIWEDLLTDTDGQYVELQSGRMYNQPATNSAYTPFKHHAFSPQATDEWTEYWYPVKHTGGITKASPIGALYWQRDADRLTIRFSPVQKMTTNLRLLHGDHEVGSRTIAMEAMKPWSHTFSLNGLPADAKLKVIMGRHELVYSDAVEEQEIHRPQTLPDDFDWHSVYGLYIKGEQWMNIKMYDKAEEELKHCLQKDPHFAPALVRLASLMIHTGKYDEALTLSRHALSLNTYDGEANYLYALANKHLGHQTDAKDGFSVATYSTGFRSAAYAQLAGLSIRKRDYTLAETYIEKSLESNARNMDALQERLICYRYTNQTEKARTEIAAILEQTPLNHFARYEAYLHSPSDSSRAEFTRMIRNELPHETYLEMALWYAALGCTNEATELCAFAHHYPIAVYLHSYLLHQTGKDKEAEALLTKANAASPAMVFPFRPEMLKPLEWAASALPSWKIDYYRALIHAKNNDKEKALELLNGCDEADYAPLFLTRAALRQHTDALADLRRAEQLKRSWRVGDALIRHYMKANDWKQANAVASEYHKRYRSNSSIGLKYARTLCETGQYAACVNLLNKLHVLPTEGSYTGRGIYRDAWLYQAIQAIEARNYAKARKAIEASKTWIENLGVGKPYDDQIDYHLEDYLQALAETNETTRMSLFEKIAGRSWKEEKYFHSNMLLTALALRHTGRESEAEQMVTQWAEKYPDNLAAKWCTLVYRGNQEAARRLLCSRHIPDESAPWETTAIDRNFNLLNRLAELKIN